MTTPFHVCWVADPSGLQGRTLLQIAAEALEGGVDAIQLRAKSVPAKEVYALARSLRDLTKARGAWFAVNDRVDVALAVEADGVHLGNQSMPVEQVRRIGPSLTVGVSCHSVEDAVRAEREGADYVFLGPVYWTLSKAEFGPPLGVQAFRHAAQSVALPVIGIGGITANQVAEVLEAGASGIAVIGAIASALNVKASARDLCASFSSPSSPSLLSSFHGS